MRMDADALTGKFLPTRKVAADKAWTNTRTRLVPSRRWKSNAIGISDFGANPPLVGHFLVCGQGVDSVPTQVASCTHGVGGTLPSHSEGLLPTIASPGLVPSPAHPHPRMPLARGKLEPFPTRSEALMARSTIDKQPDEAQVANSLTKCKRHEPSHARTAPPKKRTRIRWVALNGALPAALARSPGPPC